jgi:hypothetical protein
MFQAYTVEVVKGLGALGEKRRAKRKKDQPAGRQGKKEKGWKRPEKKGWVCLEKKGEKEVER